MHTVLVSTAQRTERRVVWLATLLFIIKKKNSSANHTVEFFFPALEATLLGWLIRREVD